MRIRTEESRRSAEDRVIQEICMYGRSFFAVPVRLRTRTAPADALPLATRNRCDDLFDDVHSSGREPLREHQRRRGNERFPYVSGKKKERETFQENGSRRMVVTGEWERIHGPGRKRRVTTSKIIVHQTLTPWQSMKSTDFSPSLLVISINQSMPRQSV